MSKTTTRGITFQNENVYRNGKQIRDIYNDGVLIGVLVRDIVPKCVAGEYGWTVIFQDNFEAVKIPASTPEMAEAFATFAVRGWNAARVDLGEAVEDITASLVSFRSSSLEAYERAVLAASKTVDPHSADEARLEAAREYARLGAFSLAIETVRAITE